MTVIKFGVGVTSAAAGRLDPVAQAVTAESLGYDFVSASDHPEGRDPTYETWTMLTWIAARTTRIAVATRVLGVPYRAPAMVAKMAESLDRLSGGRLILGLGGGYSDDEFRAFGLTVPSTRDKVDGLAEAVTIARGLWDGPAFSFAGRLHHTEEADLEPKPAHRIPIWLGTFGNRALDVTGRLADGWIPSLGYVPEENLPVMRERVRAAARGAGRDPDTITYALHLGVRVTGPGLSGVDPSDVDPSVVSGRPEQIAERLAGFRALGFTAFNFAPSGGDWAEQVTVLAGDVLPVLRAG